MSIQEGKEKLLEVIYLKYKDFSKFEELELLRGKQLPPILHKRCHKYPVTEDKILSREFMLEVFEAGQKVSVSIIKIYYLLAHLCQADLSMLSDFYEITKNKNKQNKQNKQKQQKNKNKNNNKQTFAVSFHLLVISQMQKRQEKTKNNLSNQYNYFYN